MSWHTANSAVLTEGKRRLFDDPHRFDGVRVLGVDEHVWRHTRFGDKYVTVIIDLTPNRDKTGPARLLDMVEGRSKAAFKEWLAGRPKHWRDGIEVVAMDGFTGFKTAAAEEVPTAVAVMDPFHVVRLAGDALDVCRRRIQLDICGHRGRKGDPLFAARRTLHTGTALLTDKQTVRLEALFATPEHVAGDKPSDHATQSAKKNWNQRLSDNLALAVAAELRDRGMDTVLPAEPGQVGLSGAERRLSGGIGAKKVDVSWSTEDSGLIFAVSIKTIMFRDNATGNFQKNLTNRRGDMLIESVTLHRRFPYAVLAAFFFLDAGAAIDDLNADGTRKKRKSTFRNAFPRLRLFTGRNDPAGREEQFEKFYIFLLDSNPFQPSIRAFEVNDGQTEVSLDRALDEMLELVGERNFDLYDGTDGTISKI